MSYSNPAATDGFEFLEFTTTDENKLKQQFQSMGFKAIAKHRHANITLYQQNNIRFIINLVPHTYASEFANTHGASVCAMGFKVKNAQAAYQYAISQGAKPFEEALSLYAMPAIQGIGGSLIYFIDYEQDTSNYAAHFDYQSPPPSVISQVGLTYIDHVTHNLHRGNMIEWANFYTRLFNFREVRYFDIEGKLTGLISKAMTSPCGKIRIPLNESSDDHSQIEEFLRDFNGEGIQHIALGTNNIFETVETLGQNGLDFLDTPDTYYDLIEKRLPKHGESLEALKKYRILLDGSTQPEKKLLLQIFTKNMLGPVFFEIIQRKGDEGFGEGNFRALFESIELDQIRRGVLQTEESV